MAKKKKKARSFNSEYYLFSQRQNFSEWIKYNYRIISFCALQRNPPFSSWQNVWFTYNVRYLCRWFWNAGNNHVCILLLIWSWVRPQGPYFHPHAKKYLYHPPFCMQVYFLHISLHQKRAIECVLIIQKHTPNIHVMIQCIIW